MLRNQRAELVLLDFVFFVALGMIMCIALVQIAYVQVSACSWKEISSRVARNFGVIIDDRLNLSRLRSLHQSSSKIRPYLNQHATQLLLQAVVIAPLDDCDFKMAVQSVFIWSKYNLIVLNLRCQGRSVQEIYHSAAETVPHSGGVVSAVWRVPSGGHESEKVEAGVCWITAYDLQRQSEL